MGRSILIAAVNNKAEHGEDEQRHFFARLRLRSVVFHCVEFYGIAVVLSLILAHIAFVFSPNSDLADRLIAPVGAALRFLDDHWKGTLLIVAPLFIPGAEKLLRRIRKLTYKDTKLEFEGVLEDEGVHEKPKPAPTEDTL